EHHAAPDELLRRGDDEDDRRQPGAVLQELGIAELKIEAVEPALAHRAARRERAARHSGSDEQHERRERAEREIAPAWQQALAERPSVPEVVDGERGEDQCRKEDPHPEGHRALERFTERDRVADRGDEEREAHADHAGFPPKRREIQSRMRSAARAFGMASSASSASAETSTTRMSSRPSASLA